MFTSVSFHTVSDKIYLSLKNPKNRQTTHDIYLSHVVNHPYLLISQAAASAVHEAPMSTLFVKFFAAMQVLIIIFYFSFVGYDENTDPATEEAMQHGGHQIDERYSMWQDIHVMIFIGFGFLMTFLHSYGFSALTLNFMVGVFSIEWGILCMGFFNSLWAAKGVGADMAKIPLNVEMFIEGDFAAATALISLGALLGKCTPAQALVMVTLELAFYALNYHLSIVELGASDVGGTMAIHTFGAYFGLACAWVLSKEDKTVKGHKNNGSTYHSDMFSMVGTLFLWCFWPSFVAALADGNARNRAVSHTVLSIASSCMSALVCSSLWRPHHKFNMVDVQNATLAGGVTIGAVADHYLGGGGALLVGACAGVLSTAGYVFIQPYLEDAAGLYDTCGVHNLHGMPGVLGGLASAVTASMAGSKSLYGENVGQVFGAMAGEGGRSASSQAAHQIAALGVTLGIALAGGALTGMVIKPSCKCIDSPSELYSDVTAFEVPDDGPKPKGAEGGAPEASETLA